MPVFSEMTSFWMTIRQLMSAYRFAGAGERVCGGASA
jgi:hypothetical protein